jgi:TetR/AcrR family transcriptional repressor of mexCD-oprJ operon
MQEIATEAGVGRATVHRYFPKREDLIREIALSCNAKIDDVIEPLRGQGLSAADVLWRVLEGVVPLGNQYRVLAERVLIHDPEVQAGYQRHMEQLGNLVDQLKQEGVIGADVPRAWVVRTIEALIYTAWSQASDGFIAPRDAAGLVYRTIVSGLGVTPERSNGL